MAFPLSTRANHRGTKFGAQTPFRDQAGVDRQLTDAPPRNRARARQQRSFFYANPDCRTDRNFRVISCYLKKQGGLVEWTGLLVIVVWWGWWELYRRAWVKGQ